MSSKRYTTINKRQNRKEFRKQQRKLKKKSKKLAKQFGKLRRENKLKINIQSTHNKNKNNHNYKIKPILKHSSKKKSNQNKNKNKKKHSKTVRFADEEQIKIIKPNRQKKQEKEDVWIDDREEKWIKVLEKRLGFTRKRYNNDNEKGNKYWKHQEFTQDGLDCFFDLQQLSDESDIDDQQQQEYQQYIEFKDFLNDNDNNNTHNKPSTSAQLNAFKIKQSNTEKRKKKQEIYGEAVYHSDSDDENDISMKEFLEESDCECDSQSESESEQEQHNNKNKNNNKKYLPPQLRKLQLQTNDKNIQLKRCIGGHLNRLLAHNLRSVSNIMNNFYNDNENKYSRTQVTQSICECIYNMIYDKEANNALNSIILSLSALLTLIYGTNGMVIGSNIIEIFSKHIESNINNKNKNTNNKFMYNIIRLLSYLYLFEMLNAKYILEILIQFVQQSENECFNILHIVMEICGADLRNNDPVKFKDLIILICKKSKQLLKDDNTSPKYVIQIEMTMKLIFDIKDNKLSYKNKQNIKNSRQFKQLKSSIGIINKMRMSYKDFINIPLHGRWWLAGAPVKGNNKIIKQQIKPIWRSAESAYSFPDKLMKMAKEFHMNSPIRRAIFCIVMDSDDYIDAFTKLMQLNLSGDDHIRIILLLCLRQIKYNKYYCLLLGKLIKHKKAWKFSLHCAFWDKFNEINEMQTNDILIMANLLADLINLHYLNLVVLKKMDILNVDMKNMLFVNNLFRKLLIKNNVFATLSRNNKLKELRQDIQLFFNSLMIPSTKKDIFQLKKKHKNSQLLYKQNKINKDELINVGLELRKKEDFLILIKNVLNSMEDYQVQKSVYNQLIV